MGREADVFVLHEDDGRPLSPAKQASVLAKYSRSPLSMRDLIASITEEEAREFQRKWGVQYGHSSVAENAHIPFCFEGVSIVASKFLERYQRAAYSEKSTRYQQFSPASFVSPPEGLPSSVRSAVNRCYETYLALEPRMVEIIKSRVPADTSPGVLKARVFDSLRYLLPAGTGTNLSIVANTRDSRYIMNDCLGHPLAEIRALGASMLAAAEGVAPVFAMGVKPNPQAKFLVASKTPIIPPSVSSRPTRVRLISAPSEDEFSVFNQLVAKYYGSPAGFEEAMETRGKSAAPEVMRVIRYGYQLRMDYGAYRDLQRHRRCEQYPDLLTACIGYQIPDDIQGTVIEHDYCSAMESAGRAVLDEMELGKRFVAGDATQPATPAVLQYAIPLGFLHDSIHIYDLQQVYYVGELRTQPQGHISYRRIVHEMVEVAKRSSGTSEQLLRWCRAIEPRDIGAHT